MQFAIINIRDNPDFLDIAADYFSSKWPVARQLYYDSISDSISTKSNVPRWYLMMDDEAIIGSFGLIENDFMVRKDLTPWVCALYIEENMRGKGLGASLLEHAREETKLLGFEALYLCTDHIGYYEKYGWNFFGEEDSEFGGKTRVYAINTTT